MCRLLLSALANAHRAASQANMLAPKHWQSRYVPVTAAHGGATVCTRFSKQSVTVSLPASDTKIADWSMIPVEEKNHVM